MSGKNPFEFSFRTRENSWSELRNHTHNPINILIVGGGIVGAGLIRELSLREVPSVYLIEKGDYASGTSGTSSKLIHAGIRYLEQAWNNIKRGKIKNAWENFVFVLQASNERKKLMEIAPSLVKAIPITFVLGESDDRSVGGVFFGVWFYWFIQILQGQLFPPPRSFFRKEAIQVATGEMRAENVKAMFRFFDSQTDDARLVMANLQQANLNGGNALNYVELTGYESHEDGVVADLLNHETNEKITIRTKVLINAAGPWVDHVRKKGKGIDTSTRYIDCVAGAHLDVYPPIADNSYYITASDNRLVFILKRNEDGLIYSRIGTTERPLRDEESLENLKPNDSEISYLKGLVETYLSQKPDWDRCVIRMDEGTRPLKNQDFVDPFHKSREHEIRREGSIVHVIGVKLTDYRRVALELIRDLPWKKWDMKFNNQRPTDDLLLEESGQTNLYPEKSIHDVIDHTMVLHWKDYLLRRKGLKPLIALKENPDSLGPLFSTLAQTLQWTPDQRDHEWKSVLPR